MRLAYNVQKTAAVFDKWGRETPVWSNFPAPRPDPKAKKHGLQKDEKSTRSHQPTSLIVLGWTKRVIPSKTGSVFKHSGRETLFFQAEIKNRCLQFAHVTPEKNRELEFHGLTGSTDHKSCAQIAFAKVCYSSARLYIFKKRAPRS